MAEIDHKATLDSARRRQDSLPEAVCFHCQQCAEKYLKQERDVWLGSPA